MRPEEASVGRLTRHVRRRGLGKARSSKELLQQWQAEEHFGASSKTPLERLRRSNGQRRRMMKRASSSIRRKSRVGAHIGPKPTWAPQTTTRKGMGRRAQALLILLALEEARRDRNVLKVLERKTLSRLILIPGDETLVSVLKVTRAAIDAL